MVYVHFRSLLDPTYQSFCRLGETLDCETATTSRFSSLLGVPLAFWGLAAYVAMGLLAGTRLLLPLAASAALAGVFLAAVSAFSLRVLCPLCAATWVIDWALFWLALRGRHDARSASRFWIALAAAVFGAVVVAGYLATPPLAPLAAWRDGLRLPHGTDEQGHPWIGAAQPRLVVEEFVDYTCPHCARAHARLRAEVERRSDAVRLVRHDYARMRCKTPPNPATSRICIHARLAYCAGRAGRFWPMSDWLFSRPDPYKRPDLVQAARGAGVDQKELEACLARPETYQAAHREYEHAHALGIAGTPAFAVGGKRSSLAEAVEAIRKARQP